MRRFADLRQILNRFSSRSCNIPHPDRSPFQDDVLRTFYLQRRFTKTSSWVARSHEGSGADNHNPQPAPPPGPEV